MKIPLNKPHWGRKEKKAVNEALDKSIGTGDGPFSKKLEKQLVKLTGTKYTRLATSCTHGLELSMMALGIGSGDEVIIPSFTMTSTANAVVLQGAKPIFADIDDKFYNIDPEDIKRKITNRTKGIIVVHYAGMPVEIEKIKSLAKKHNLFVVADAAHTIGSYYKDKMLGTWFDIGVFSFHGTKNITCGEGGAVLTDSRKLIDRIDIIRANGTNRKMFLEGAIDKYSWVVKGSSYYLSDILASILLQQIYQIKTITNKRNQIATIYSKSLSKYSNIIQLPGVPANTKPNWHIYGIKFESRKVRKFFQKKMNNKGIEVATHYVPLHTSVMGKSLGGDRYKLPVTDNVSQTLVRLPIYPGLTKSEINYILTSAQKILQKMK